MIKINRVKRLISSLFYNHVNNSLECILPRYFLWFNDHAPLLLNDDSHSISISFFSVLFIELQEQHSYLIIHIWISFEEFMYHY